jgi:DNA repair protein endonuclease SAE2/CtIP C-terminus
VTNPSSEDKRIAALEAELTLLKTERAECYEENASLFNRLAAAKNFKGRTPRASIEKTPGTPEVPKGSPAPSKRNDGDVVPAADYAFAVERVNHLYRKLKTTEDALEQALQKAKEFKATCKEWRKYADKCNDKLKKREAEAEAARNKAAGANRGQASGAAEKTGQSNDGKGTSTGNETSPSARMDVDSSGGIPPTHPINLVLANLGSPSKPPSLDWRSSSTILPSSPGSGASSAVATVVASATSPGRYHNQYEEIGGGTTVPKTLQDTRPNDNHAQNQAVTTFGEPRSSQTTEDDNALAADRPLRSGNEDSQQVASSSSNKRKRAAGDDIQIHEDGGSLDTQHDPIQVKEEPPSSPASMPPPAKRQLLRTDTIDLDEVGNRIDTPRRRKRREALLRHARSFKNIGALDLQNERSNSLPRENEAGLSDDDADEESTRHAIANHLERANSDPLIKVEDKTYDELVSTPLRSFAAVNNRFQARPAASRALHSIDGNNSTLPRTVDPSKAFERRRDPQRGANAIHIVTEDGSFRGRGQHQHPKARAKSPRAIAKANDRLSNLLHDHPQAAKHSLSPLNITTASTAILARTNPIQLPTPLAKSGGSSITSFGSARQNAKPMRLSKLLGAARIERGGQDREPYQLRTPPTTRPNSADKHPAQQPPLRSRPLEQLNLDDFKPNPNANPYTSSDGNREFRRHLPGCTDPNCPQGCSLAMRALAHELNSTVPQPLFTNTQDWDSMSEDERLLRWHLGHSYNATSIARMPADERRELVMQARTQLVAKSFARHRVQVQARGKSPPGFWRTEMPTTQEVERDGEEARKLEREKVRERWREAMREGGLWKFKDE